MKGGRMWTAVHGHPASWGKPVDDLGTDLGANSVIMSRVYTGRRNHRHTRGELVENRGMT